MFFFFFSPETLFSKLGIYFNICLLGNCHLLYGHRVSDIQSSSSRGQCDLWEESHTSWAHSDWVNCLFFFLTISHSYIFLWLNSEAFQSCDKHKAKSKQAGISLLDFLCEFWASDLGNVDNLAWVCEARFILFWGRGGLDNADKHTAFFFHLLWRTLPVIDRSATVTTCHLQVSAELFNDGMAFRLMHCRMQTCSFLIIFYRLCC